VFLEITGHSTISQKCTDKRDAEEPRRGKNVSYGGRAGGNCWYLGDLILGGPGTPIILSMSETFKKLKRQTATQRDKSALLHKARYYVGLIFDSIMQPLEFYLW
jgi:hypothetical protein